MMLKNVRVRPENDRTMNWVRHGRVHMSLWTYECRFCYSCVANYPWFIRRFRGKLSKAHLLVQQRAKKILCIRHASGAQYIVRAEAVWTIAHAV